MSLSRRSFLTASAAAAAGAGVRARAAKASGFEAPPPAGYEPWVEVDAAALAHNAASLSRLCGGRPILGVVKNGAYGLGLATAGPILDRLTEVAGLAVVKPGEALELRDAGVRKPILLMGRADEETAIELLRHDVRLAPFGSDAPERLARLSRRLGRPVPVHLYLDTGMSRLGVPFREALPWMERIASEGNARIEGAFTTLTEEDEFDPVQLGRFREIAGRARARGIELGTLHAASSHSLFFRPAALFDMVRPGLALYGAYPAGARELATANLRPAFRLRARVVRMARLEPGDGVSYGREYIAERPVWIATLP
ncbi:MAG: alanine racemase, partial [Gemmatimonadota bacterium]